VARCAAYITFLMSSSTLIYEYRPENIDSPIGEIGHVR
jgi:hypothetical protein